MHVYRKLRIMFAYYRYISQGKNEYRTKELTDAYKYAFLHPAFFLKTDVYMNDFAESSVLNTIINSSIDKEKYRRRMEKFNVKR